MALITTGQRSGATGCCQCCIICFFKASSGGMRSFNPKPAPICAVVSWTCHAPFLACTHLDGTPNSGGLPVGNKSADFSRSRGRRGGSQIAQVPDTVDLFAELPVPVCWFKLCCKLIASQTLSYPIDFPQSHFLRCSSFVPDRCVCHQISLSLYVPLAKRQGSCRRPSQNLSRSQLAETRLVFSQESPPLFT